MDVSVAGVEIQRSLSDAMGLEGRTRHATRSRILRGRDPRSIHVLIPDGAPCPYIAVSGIDP